MTNKKPTDDKSVEEVTEEVTPTLKIEKVEHTNIYSAFSAFQGELKSIKKNGKVSFAQKNDPTKSVEFKYATLDDIMVTINPLLGKHGLAVNWELDSTKENNGIECIVYHETTEKKSESVSTTSVSGENSTTISEFIYEWYNVMRSGKFPIDITTGDMKDRGGNITYGRRYTIGVVLGVVSEEDRDVEQLEEKSKANVKSFAKKKVTDDMKLVTTREGMQDKIDFFKKEIQVIEVGKYAPSLGLTKEEYEELISNATKILVTLPIT